MTDAVLDSSAVLAFLLSEPGAETIGSLLAGAEISTVNLAEVLTKLVDLGDDLMVARTKVSLLAVAIAPFDEEQATAVAALRSATARRGLSLGDRACLALANARSAPAVTADRAWSTLDLGVEVRLVR